MDRSLSAKSLSGAPSDGAELPCTVRCWGVRGSVPDPGPQTARYGGNTSCVEVRAGEERIILDAGTGIRRLGEKLMEGGEDTRAVIFLTHFHWDHIQGLPFFAPAYDRDFQLKIFGPDQEDRGIEALLAGQMDYAHFPVSQEDLPASFTCAPVEEGSWRQGLVEIQAVRVCHPSVTFGYRLEVGGRSVVFVPDNELGKEPSWAFDGWAERFEAFVQGADVLIHDAMFTEAERPMFEGWGHSTVEEVLDLALRVGVKRTFLFHHAPGRSDEELDEILDRSRDRLATRGDDLEIDAATEGMEIVL